MARVHPDLYFFGGGTAEGRATMRELLGGKGANLAEMASLKLPVPPGFTISTRVNTYYYTHGKTYPKGLEAAVRQGDRPGRKADGTQVRQRVTIHCWCRSAPAPASQCPG